MNGSYSFSHDSISLLKCNLVGERAFRYPNHSCYQAQWNFRMLLMNFPSQKETILFQRETVSIFFSNGQ
jgi:hypothetical protein